MPVYRPAVLDPRKTVWALGTVVGEFLVRARDDIEARRLVADHCAGPAVALGAVVERVPWWDPKFMRADAVDVPDELQIGEACILAFSPVRSEATRLHEAEDTPDGDLRRSPARPRFNVTARSPAPSRAHLRPAGK